MKRSWLFLILLTVLIPSGTIFAAEEIVTVEVQGWGASRESAIQAACIEGVKQINGFLFTSESGRQEAFSQSSTTANGSSKRTSSISSASGRGMEEKVNGAIRGYDVLSMQKEKDGQWHAVLSVQVLKQSKYVTPGIDPNTRRRIVVVPFEVREPSYKVGDQLLRASVTSSDLRDALEKFLVQSRRFTVLGRKDAEAKLKEKNIILNESASFDEIARIGAVLGTDYLLCGEIKEFVILAEQVFTDRLSMQVRRVRAKVDYRIVVMPTSQVKWAGQALIDFNLEQCKSLRGDVASAYEALLDVAARDICLQALGNIYPIRGMRVLEDGQVALNQGGALRREGELLDAYRLGENIVDVYTKESLGRVETRIATLQIVRVEAKLSYAKVIEGAVSAADVSAGVVCRPSRALIIQGSESKKATNNSPTRNEGVKIPF